MVSRRFCSICGKVTDALLENVCQECYVKENDPVTLKEKLDGIICKNCYNVYRKGRWFHVGGTGEDAARAAAADAVEDSIDVKLQDPKWSINIDDIKETPKGYVVSCSVKVSGVVMSNTVGMGKKTVVNVRSQLCKNCTRQLGGYFESILQVRGEFDRKETARVVENLIASFSKKDKKAFITDVAFLKHGIDFYIGSTRVARKIANVIKGKNCRTKESPKLVGVDKQGKRLYRVTILVRMNR